MGLEMNRWRREARKKARAAAAQATPPRVTE